MGGGKGTQTPSPEVTNALSSNINALTQIAGTEEGNAQTLFSLVEPGLVQSEDWAQQVMSGDPGAIMKALAPATQQISQATTGAIKNIENTTAPGGEKNLAIENAQTSEGAQIGSTAASAVANAPTMLANLASGGISESTGLANTAVGATGAATTAAGTMGSEQLQEQQIQAQNKGSGLGALVGLAGAGAEVGSSEIGANATKGLTDALAFA